MDKSQLMQMAVEAGFTSAQRSDVLLMESLRVFAQAVDAQVREECAKICESMAEDDLGNIGGQCYDCAAAIRKSGG